MTKIRLIHSTCTNPYWNLAMENWIFRDMLPDTHVLFLWRNQDTVVIGRFQNPWSECALDKMQEDNIYLARRQSGGGAVFQDLGNSNFTFMGPKNEHRKEDNFNIVIKALKRLGLDTYTSGRNDLLIDDALGAKKVSGSAFKNAIDRSFHHGTMLLNTDLAKLANYLRPHPKKLQSKGVASVQSRVTNLILHNPEIDHKSFCDAMTLSFFEHHQLECPIETMGLLELKQIELVGRYAGELEDWKWRIGETPRFQHFFEERFEWGSLEVHLDAHRGLITRAEVFSDSLFPDMIASLRDSLPGKTYGHVGIDAALQCVQEIHPQASAPLEDMRKWLQEQIK